MNMIYRFRFSKCTLLLTESLNPLNIEHISYLFDQDGHCTEIEYDNIKYEMMVV